MHNATESSSTAEKWWCEWQGKVESTVTDTWGVRLLRRKQTILWEATNFDHQRRALVTLDYASLTQSAAKINNTRNMVKMDDIVKQLVGLCQRGQINIAMTDDDQATDTGNTDNPDINIMLVPDDETNSTMVFQFTLNGQHWDYRDVALAQLESDNKLLRQEISEHKDRSMMLSKPVLKLAMEHDSDRSLTMTLSEREERVEELQKRLNDAAETNQDILDEAYGKLSRKMSKYKSVRRRVGELKSELEMSEVKNNELSLQVDRLTDSLSAELARQVTVNWEMKRLHDKIAEEGIPEWLDALKQDWRGKSKEICKNGTPLYFHKLADYMESDNPWDMMQCKYLFTHRRKASATSQGTWKDRNGVVVKGNILHYCAGNPRLSGMMKWLLKDGSIDPNLRANDQCRNSPLLIAVDCGNLAGVEILLMDDRVDSEQVNNNGCSALMISIKRNNPRMLALLCEFGCDLNRMYESKNKKDGKVRRRNALHLCAESDSSVILLDWLLKSGLIDPNIRTDDAWQSTALMIAAARCNLSGAALLLKDSRVDIDAINSHGSTALMHAAGFGHESMLALLLDHGCDSSIQNRYGQTLWDKSRERRESEIRASFGIFTSQGLNIYGYE